MYALFQSDNPSSITIELAAGLGLHIGLGYSVCISEPGEQNVLTLCLS